MYTREDKLSQRVLKAVTEADAPLETMEILEFLKGVTRTKVLYRLHNLRGEGLIKGKAVGSGKQAWIWWDAKLFENGK